MGFYKGFIETMCKTEFEINEKLTKWMCRLFGIAVNLSSPVIAIVNPEESPNDIEKVRVGKLSIRRGMGLYRLITLMRGSSCSLISMNNDLFLLFTSYLGICLLSYQLLYRLLAGIGNITGIEKELRADQQHQVSRTEPRQAKSPSDPFKSP